MVRRLIRKKPQRSEDSYVAQEIEEAIQRLLLEAEATNDPRIRETIMEAVRAVQEDGNLDKLYDITSYKRTPVSIDEFLYGNVYLGLHPSELYPGVKEAIYELDSGKYVEAVLKGSIGAGKTTVSNIMILRELYKISCMRHPQITFGVQRNSSLVFTIQSVRLATAKKAVFNEMGQMIQNSPYFQQIYPYDPRITSEMVFRQQNVTIMPVSSSDTGAISMNVIGGALDEVNFMQKVAKSKQDGADIQGDYDQAKTLYQNLSKRRRSRFMNKGKLPGILFLISSSRFPDDFTEVKAAEAESEGGMDKQIYVYSKSLWEAKGEDRYSKERFRVVIGNEVRQSVILANDQPLPFGTNPSDVIEVPEDLRVEFTKDLDGAIRDLAGRTTLATHPFIQNRDTVFAAMQTGEKFGYRNIFAQEFHDFAYGPPQIIEDNLRTDIKQMRVAHIDLSVNRDSAGLVIGHVAGIRAMLKTDPFTGTTQSHTLPVIGIDGMLRINPPRNGEIDFAAIRALIIRLREEYGLPIHVVTTDGYQSVDFRQIMAKRGFRAEYVSVDKTTQPYISLRESIYDGRTLMPKHQFVQTELIRLEYVRQGTKDKVDHPATGCFTGDTEIRLSDGTTCRMDALPENFSVWGYGDGYTQVAGRNPRITRYTDMLVELVLANGEIVRCTEDHLFLLEDGTYKAAKDLTDSDELRSLQ